MAQETINLGAAPNDRTGDNARTAGGKLNRMFGEIYATQSQTLNAADPRFDAPTNEGKIDNAINMPTIGAVATGADRVFVPASMLPYDGTLVTFSAAVQMVREGGNFSVYDVTAYGLNPNTMDDQTTALQRVEDLRPAGQILLFPPGVYVVNSAYDGTVGQRGLLLRVTKSGIWDFDGATLQYGSATNLTVGADGGGLGVINVLADNVTVRGSIDGQSKANYPLAFKSQATGIRLNVTIANTLETNGTWAGLSYAASSDVTGTAIAGRTTNVSGFLNRPNCPFSDTTDTITAYGNVAAVLVGGTQVVANATSLALVLGGPTSQFNFYAAGIGKIGIMSTAKEKEGNDHWFDLVAHELGANVIELYGHGQFENNFGLTSAYYLALATKSAAVAAWYHYNVSSTSTTPPNVLISGGTAQSEGLIDLDPTTAASGGRLILKQVPLADQLNIPTNCAKGNYFLVGPITASDRTMSAPTNARKGQRITHEIVQDGTGGRALSWNAVFLNAWSNTGNTANKRSTISHLYNGTNWVQDGAQAPYV